jgi:hypothetical protein
VGTSFSFMDSKVGKPYFLGFWRVEGAQQASATLQKQKKKSTSTPTSPQSKTKPNPKNNKSLPLFFPNSKKVSTFIKILI